jgi:hypothetical protein
MYSKGASIWKGVSLGCSEALHLKGVRKTTRDPSEHSIDSNKALYEYKLGPLMLCQPASLIYLKNHT